MGWFSRAYNAFNKVRKYLGSSTHRLGSKLIQGSHTAKRAYNRAQDWIRALPFVGEGLFDLTKALTKTKIKGVSAEDISKSVEQWGGNLRRISREIQ